MKGLPQPFRNYPTLIETFRQFWIDGDYPRSPELPVLFVGVDDCPEETPSAFEEIDKGGATVKEHPGRNPAAGPGGGIA